jgi:hypothetical protein
VQERPQRGRRHRLVVLEHGVQADHGDLAGREGRGRLAQLRHGAGDAAGAQHLEGRGEDDPAGEVVDGEAGRGVVEPL